MTSQEQADVKRFLIATTALVLMSATANASNLWEEGIAATLFYEANCGGGIPRDMLKWQRFTSVTIPLKSSTASMKS
ncbi:MAG: hypothetical protein WBM12_05575 [Pseudolabrys sp.]